MSRLYLWAPCLSRFLKDLRLDFLHSCQPRISHRDLKTENVLLRSEDIDAAVAKVADFGVSTTSVEKSKMSTASLKGGTGTLSWSAPETFKGEYSEKNDTYAFAMVMYETLTKVNKKKEERGFMKR